MDEVLRETARRLRIARAGAGITQEQAAGACGLSQCAVSLYERGRRDPSSMALRGLAIAYGVSTDWLLGLSEEMGR